MVTNITVYPVDNACVVYLQDGTSYTVEPQQTHGLQLVDEGFCSISETASAAGVPPPPERIAEAWQAFWAALREEMEMPEDNDGPVVNPL